MKIILDISIFAFMLLSIYILWLAAVNTAGSLKKDRNYPVADREGRFAVIVCARNEERVIGQLLDSLNRQNYGRENYRVFVVAHNCTDNTATIAEEHGAKVYIRNNGREKKKVYALKYALDMINSEFPGFFDYYAVLDADCLADKNFLKEINNALDTGADIVSGKYSAKNYSANIISRLSGMLYAVVMQGNSRAMNNLFLPVNIYGSGYACRMKCADNLEQYQSQAADFEFSTCMVMRGAVMVYAPAAVIYAEMPVTLHEALTQRRRWSMGDTQCFRQYGMKLFRMIPSLGISGFKQFMDLCMNPVCVLTFLGFMLWLVSAICIGVRASDIIIAASAAILYIAVTISFALQTVCKGKMSLSENIAAVLLFPIWVFLSFIFAVETFFMKDVEWKETVRTSGISIEEIQGERQ